LSDDQFLSILAVGIAPRDLDPRLSPAANAERVGRIKRLIRGECRPSGVDDVRYPACASGASASGQR
jgi:hypothetical protein